MYCSMDSALSCTLLLLYFLDSVSTPVVRYVVKRELALLELGHHPPPNSSSVPSPYRLKHA